MHGALYRISVSEHSQQAKPTVETLLNEHDDEMLSRWKWLIWSCEEYRMNYIHVVGVMLEG